MSGAHGTVLVTSRSFAREDDAAERALADAGLAVRRGAPGHDLTELAPLLAGARAWIAGTGPVTAEHLAAAPGLRVLARYGVGVDNVDLRAAARHGVTVTNTPAANTTAVADLTLALLLAALRHVTSGDRDVRAGGFTARRGRELGALTVGLVGFGRIGRAVAERLGGFGCPLLVCDPWAPDAEVRARGATPAGLAELAATCDAVSLHAPGGRRVVDASWLSGVRPGMVLVNTARADLVDEDAVARALRDGVLAGYAADTLSGEAGPPGERPASPLLAADLRDAVVLTPHAGAQTVQAVDRMSAGAARAVLDVLAGRTPEHVVPTEEGVRP